MSKSDYESINDRMKPELFMPASIADMNAIATEIDTILDRSNKYEAIETQLLGDFEGLNYGIRSEIEFEGHDKTNRSYDAYFELNDTYFDDPSDSTLKIGFDYKDGAYAEFDNIKINHADTVNKLAYYASHLMKLVVFSEEEPKLINDDYFMHTAGAGHGIIQRILESETIPAIETVHNYYDNHETSSVKDFKHEDLAEATMSWLQKNEFTKIKNSKALVIEMSDNTDFAIQSQRFIKNHRRDSGLDIATSRSLEYTESKQDDNNWKQDKSIELNLEHRNDQLDLNLTNVVTHNGETGFMDEVKELISSRNSAYGGLDNQIIKKPIVADIAFFNQKLGEALKIIAKD